jgi:hypothetical protein
LVGPSPHRASERRKHPAQTFQHFIDVSSDEFAKLETFSLGMLKNSVPNIAKTPADVNISQIFGLKMCLRSEHPDQVHVEDFRLSSRRLQHPTIAT